jgi:hypothetical protein
MHSLMKDERGNAMVIALAFITILALLAAVVANVATSEKKTTFNETMHAQAFYSADAGGEAAINWIRFQARPPLQLDNEGTVFAPAGYSRLQDKDQYKYGVQYEGKQFRPGWSHEYKDFRYEVESDGASAARSAAEIEVNVLRLYREGY